MRQASAVFLDRDGVLNQAVVRNGHPYAPRSLDQLQILPGVPQACRKLCQGGYLLIMVTNQPDIARGVITKREVARMNERLKNILGLHEVRTCPHDDVDFCRCRKPKAGMLLDAASRWHINLSSSVMVGDRWSDIEAGRRAGCRTVFIDNNYEESRPVASDLHTTSLREATAWILSISRNGEKRLE